LNDLTSRDFISKVNDQESKIKRLYDEIEQLNSEIKTIEPTLKKLEDQNPTVSSLALLYDHGKSLGLIDGKCPLCGSALTEKEFEDHLFSIDQRVKISSESLSSLIKKQKHILESIKANETILRRESFELEAFLNRKKTIEERFYELDQELNKFEVKLDVKDINSLSRKYDDFDSSINDLRNSINILQISRSYEKVLEIEKQIGMAKEESDNISKRIQYLQEVQLKIKNDYDLIRRSTGEIIDERLAEISPLLVELYYRLKPHIDWDKISYNIRGDVSRFLSLRTNDDLNPNFIFSSGQRRAVGLAFLLAVHLSIQWSNLETLILDDPIQHVDDYRALHFVETLSSIRMTNKQVICTVEDPELAHLLCRRLRSKTENVGKFVEMSFESGLGVKVESEKTIKAVKRDVLLAS